MMLAFLRAVASCVPPLAAAEIAAFTAAARSLAPPRFAVFTLNLTPLPSKPGPFTTKVVNPRVVTESVIVALARIIDKLVEAEPDPMSVPEAPLACTPLRPKLAESTVDRLKSSDTEPLVVALLPFEDRPPPVNTKSAFANCPR